MVLTGEKSFRSQMMPFKRKNLEVNDLEEAKKSQSRGKKEKIMCSKCHQEWEEADSFLNYDKFVSSSSCSTEQ